jgi:hypothetical protein
VTLLKLGAPTQLNYSALAVFVRLGFFLNEQTPFEGIKAVPPGASLEWRDGQLRITSQTPVVSAQNLSRADAIDAYISLFQEAIRRRLPCDENFAVLLSGGRDSRHILLELLSAGFNPKFALTVRCMPPKYNSDVEIANRICEETNISQVVLDHADNVFLAEARKNMLTNFCSPEHAWLMPAVDYLNWSKCHTAYDGIGGDVLSNGLYLTHRRLDLMEKGLFYDLANELLGDERRFGLLKLTEHTKLDRLTALRMVASELEKHANNPNPIGSFIFWNRTRRHIALSPYALFHSTQTVFSPYLDHNLYDFFASLPARMMVDPTFHDDAISKAYPRYAHIPYATSSTSGRNCTQLYRRFTRDILRYSMHHRSSPVKSTYLLPRLVRCLFDPGYSSSIMWLGPLTLYLTQLKELELGRWDYVEQ